MLPKLVTYVSFSALILGSLGDTITRRYSEAQIARSERFRAYGIDEFDYIIPDLLIRVVHGNPVRSEEAALKMYIGRLAFTTVTDIASIRVCVAH